MEIKDSICNDCIHKDVCCYAMAHRIVFEKANKASVGYPGVFNVTVECKYFKEDSYIKAEHDN